MWDRKLKKQLKVKMLEACVVPACIYGLGKMALTEIQEEMMQIGTIGQDWKTIAEDRGRWRALTSKVEEATK